MRSANVSTVSRASAAATCGFAIIVVAIGPPARAPSASGTELSFEVASIKPNAQGFIELGGGLRLLSGQTRCRAVDTPAIPGDPLPPTAPGRCVIRNSTLKEMINVASLTTALQEQFGLRLERQTVPVEVVVIDSVERPTPN